MGGGGVIETEGMCDVTNTIFVAVGKNVKESKSTLLWALQSFPGRKISLLHVHQPTQLVTLMDGKLSASKLKQHAIKVCHELARQKMHKLLNQYLVILAQGEVQAGKVWMERDNIEKGIVEIIAQYGIKWLVMGAAAEKHYSMKLSELKSNKAIFVFHQAPVSCHVWFICKGCLIWTSSHVGSMEALSSSTCSSTTILLQDHVSDADEDASTSSCLEDSTKVIDKVVDTLKSTPLLMDEMKEDGLVLSPLKESHDCLLRSSSVTMLEEESQGQATCDIYDKLEHAMIDAENAKQKGFEESVRRWKAEEDAMEAISKAEASASLCTKEINQRKEMEEMLASQTQELELMKNRHGQFMKELQIIRDQKSVLESRIMESRCMEEELEEKIIQAVKLLISFKEKRDELQAEHDNAVKEIKGQRKSVKEDALSSCGPQLFAFSFMEIFEATRNFDPSLKIGEGRCGTVYKGCLRHTKVAIKMLPSCGSQGDSEFKHEVGVLSKMRHPNLVTLIGICPESRSLIYEYLENGSLDDRLVCRGKTLPIPWQTRIKIATEICSALTFIHSNNPSIVHGNLKLTKVLLDANFGSKISDLGIHKLIPHVENPIDGTKQCNKIQQEVSIYMDPEFLETGELTAESDVYSFGIVLLRLLTGRPGLDIVKDVKCALERGNFDTVLDFGAGDWPLEQAKRLARLALRCCEKKRFDRPGLMADVLTVIEPMTNLCTSLRPETEGHHRIPSYFLCPIFQEVMKDPYIAADGFTYEADAIKGWLNSGHKTSPMTNLQLDNCDLLPNYALYYAIQEWQQQC